MQQGDNLCLRLAEFDYSIAGDVDGLRHTEGEIVTGKETAAPLEEMKGCVMPSACWMSSSSARVLVE